MVNDVHDSKSDTLTKYYSATQMLFGTKLRLKSGQVLGEFVPVLCIQAERHICHKLVKAQRKPLVLVWWLHNNSRKIRISKLEIIAIFVASGYIKKWVSLQDMRVVKSLRH